MDSSAPSDSLNGLKFGQKIYFEDVGVSSGSVGNNPNKSGSSGSCSSAGDVTPASPAKKGRFGGGGGGQGGQQPPRCQVDGCKVDLSDAKGYYARHKVCVMHSKSSMVVVSGNEQRFCQQCSRFHHLPEFDQGKRSCRRRLAGHNERRRKPPPGSLLSTCYGGLSSTLYEHSSGTGSFVDFTTYPRAAWRDQSTPTRTFEQVAGNQHHVFRNLLPWQSNSESPQPEIQGSINNPSHGTDISSGGFFTGAADSGCALSLLSSQPCNLKGQYSNLGSNYELDTDSTHMVQPTALHGANISHFPRSSWDYKGNETGTSSLNMHSDSTLGQITQTGNRVYNGDLQVNQQRGRTSTSLEQSRAYYSSAHNPHWSI